MAIFKNWNPNTTLRNLGVSYNILDEDKVVIMTLSSANVASSVLGIPNTTLRRYTNLSLHKLYSPALDKFIYIVDPTRPLSTDNPKFSTEEYSSLTGIELNTLSLGVLYVLDLNKNIRPYGNFSRVRPKPEGRFGTGRKKYREGCAVYTDRPSQKYSNIRQAHIELNAGNMSRDIRYISRAINKERTVKLKNGSLVYFAMNPLWFNDSRARQSQRIFETARRNTKSIVLVDMSVDQNSGILFDTVRDLLYHLGYTALGGTGVVKRYMGCLSSGSRQWQIIQK